jgi:hypothetical protein
MAITQVDNGCDMFQLSVLSVSKPKLAGVTITLPIKHNVKTIDNMLQKIFL